RITRSETERQPRYRRQLARQGQVVDEPRRGKQARHGSHGCDLYERPAKIAPQPPSRFRGHENAEYGGVDSCQDEKAKKQPEGRTAAQTIVVRSAPVIPDDREEKQDETRLKPVEMLSQKLK